MPAAGLEAGDERGLRGGLATGVRAEVAECAELELGEVIAVERLVDLEHGIKILVVAEKLHVLQRLLEHQRHLRWKCPTPTTCASGFACTCYKINMT
jgi:hypothetical protein